MMFQSRVLYTRGQCRILGSGSGYNFRLPPLLQQRDDWVLQILCLFSTPPELHRQAGEQFRCMIPFRQLDTCG